MSIIQSLGQQISSLSTESSAIASNLFSIANGLKRTTATVQQTMKGTSQSDYQTLVDQLSVAQNKLSVAAECLTAASKDAQSWLAAHISASSGGAVFNQIITPTYEATDPAAPTLHDTFDRDGASQVFSEFIEPLEGRNVAYRAIQPFGRERSTEEIIERLGGGDNTQGSCSSLAFAYIGNVAGYDVLDFRDGDSRSFFSRNGSIEKIANLPGVNALIYNGKDDLICANDLLSTMQTGKEYYLATGLHASIVRKIDGHYEYLELQHPTDNGWHILNDTVLLNRFGCSQSNTVVYPNFLIDIESLAGNEEFLEILGYLNTAESEQHKGENGSVR